MQWIVKRRYFFIGILVLLVIIGTIFTTYAVRLWGSSENTEFDTTIGNIAGVKFSNGDNVNVTDLGPVFDYHDGANVEFYVFNMTSSNIIVKVNLNILSISNELKSSQFKYVLTRYNNSTKVYDEVSSGDFDSFNTGSNIIVNNDSIGSGYNYYKFYVYIDGNVENNIDMMGKSMRSILAIDAE